MASKSTSTATGARKPIAISATGTADATGQTNDFLKATGPAETEWRITIQNSDGTTSEVMLSPISDKPPQKREIKIIMVEQKEKDQPADAAKAEKADPTQDAAKTERKIKIWQIGQHVLTSVLSITIIAVMALTLVTYRRTQDVEGAWPKNPLLSPTIVMLSTAVITCVADFITVCIHCCHGRVAAHTTKMVEHIRTCIGIIQAMAAAAGAGFFGASKQNSGGNDIWGFACSDKGDAMGEVNCSEMLCQSNTAAFWLGLLQVVVHVLSVGIALWTLFKPGQGFKTNAEEAKQLLSDNEANLTKVNDTFGIKPAA